MSATPSIINQGQSFIYAEDSQVLTAAQFKFKGLPGYPNQANHDIRAQPQPDLPNELHQLKVRYARSQIQFF